MRDKSMNSFSEGVLQYETPLCEVFTISTEKTILSTNEPGRAGNYNSDNDIIIEDEF